MRDILLTAAVLGTIPFILKRPWVGALVWVVLGVLNPHRLTWGFAFDLPFSQLVAGATFLGMVFSKEPKRMLWTPPVAVLLALVLWWNVTTVFALDFDDAVSMWGKVMKIQIMIFVTIYVLHKREHAEWLVIITCLCLAFYGIKGGLHTILTGGANRVYGPLGSFIQENNSLGLATVMNIPLLFYLRMRATNRWIRHALLLAIGLSFFSALGSQSRGALVAISAMVVFLWFKSRSKIMTGMVLICLVPVAIQFMPESWERRMESIQTYQEDGSAMGRINAWSTATNIALDRPLVGGGFEYTSIKVFNEYSPDPTKIHAPHSIYFQALGEHGFVGLFLYLLFWFLIWRSGAWIIRHSKGKAELAWANDMARMIQVSLLGFAVGGAFLNLGYFDVPYNLAVALILTRHFVEQQIKSSRQGAGAVAGGAVTRPAAPGAAAPALSGGHGAPARATAHGAGSPPTPTA